MSRGVLAAGLCIAAAMSVGAQSPLNPPVAKVVPHITILHSEKLVDNYHWLRDKSSPDVMAYLQAENAYTEAGMKRTVPLQDVLYKEILGRIKETDAQVPQFEDGYWYYTRTEGGKNYPIFCRKKGTLQAAEEIVLDQNELAAGKKFHALSGLDVSPNGSILLYLEDLTAFREYTLHVKDLATGRILDSLPNVWNGTAWASDNKTFFYMTADAAKRGNAVWRHVIGTPRDEDVKVFQEDNVLNNLWVFRSRSEAVIFIPSVGFTSSEWRVLPADRPTTTPRVIAARRPNVEYSVEHGGGYFYIRTNDEAPNFRIVRAPDSDGSPSSWADWRPHSRDVFIENAHVFKSSAVIAERRAGLRRLRVVDLSSRREHEVTFPEDAYGVSTGANPEFDTEMFRFTYSSLVTPASVFDYNMETRVRELKKTREIPSGFDPTGYVVERKLSPARDGAQIPVSILRRKDSRRDGSSPLLLYAYGSYGVTTEPTFNSDVFSLVDRGMTFAVAHIRGGQEMGRQWYDDGKMMKKKNTFNDFIDVAEDLVNSGYTSSSRLVVNGASAGGLLMGAVANMRPDLFRAVVADVPFVDVINTMLDETLPLAAQEWEQWGNPKNLEHFTYMRSYSPYDNVERKTYPWILVTASFHDSQVMYWEPAKWVAKLRATKADTNPLYFKINLAGGHGGSSGRYDRLREVAFRYAFMLDAVALAN